MTRAEERVLVEQAQTDPRKFDAVYLAFIDEIYRFVYYKTSVKETAEDITAQVFMHALEQVGKFQYKPGARFSSWLYAIARNQVIDHYRKHRETVDLEATEPLPAPETSTTQVDQHIQQDRVRAVLQTLPPDDQTILQLRLWQDQSYSEIAQTLDSNSVAMRARYSRALKKFNLAYTKHYGQTN
jgi:RNA polymerase sigma-70 factor (ECF subfamily)